MTLPHKFKIGEIVFYRPKQRMFNAARGTYTVTGFLPVPDGQPPEYRIKRFSENFERIAEESELSV